MEPFFRLIVKGLNGKYYDDEEDLPLEAFGGVAPAAGDLFARTLKDRDDAPFYHEVYRVLYRGFREDAHGSLSAVVVERVKDIPEDLKQALGLVYPIR
jgi:hypothetical protein